MTNLLMVDKQYPEWSDKLKCVNVHDRPQCKTHKLKFYKIKEMN